jgi:hypothetical protein
MLNIDLKISKCGIAATIDWILLKIETLSQMVKQKFTNDAKDLTEACGSAQSSMFIKYK